MSAQREPQTGSLSWRKLERPAQATGSMPPKGKKAARTDAASTTDWSSVTIELRGGEKDPQNVAYHAAVLDAWHIVQGHSVFDMIEAHVPLSIAMGGSLAPFSQKELETSCSGELQAYTCGINFSWVNLLYSATPGIPIRMAAVQEVTEKTFLEPTPVESLLIGIPSHDYNVKSHKGALMRVSPEEMTSAFIMAVARDITNGAPEAVLLKWRRTILSTPCKFVILATPMDRYWHALRVREDLVHQYKACHRSCYQRLHEVVRLMDAMRTRMPQSQVTTERVEEEYRKNVRNMDMSGGGAITGGFVKVAVTVARRMLAVPEIAEIMRAADAQPPSVFNPFGAHTRLQAMIDKCKSTEDLTWCCQALAFKVSREELSGLTAAQIRGVKVGADSKGLFDLLLHKRSFRDALIAWGLTTFRDHPVVARWIQQVVAPKMQDFSTWNTLSKSGDLTWRAGRFPAEIAWLNLLTEITFGSSYDAPLMVSLKGNDRPEEALTKSTFLVAVESIHAQMERKGADGDDAGGAGGGGEAQEDNEPEGNKADEIEFTWEEPKETGGDTPETKTVKMSEMREDVRESVQKITRDARVQMRAQVQLVPLVKHDEHGNAVPYAGGLLAEILKTTVHKTEPVANKFVGIFYDPKLSGEPNGRPQVRTCGVRETYKDLITAMLKRHGEPEDPIGMNDLYFLLDGSKLPNQAQLMKPFPAKKAVKEFRVFREEESVLRRYEKVRGVCTVTLDEGLHLVSRAPLSVPPRKFIEYLGSTAGSMIGPVMMPSSPWTVSWPDKKKLYGATNFLLGGGKLGPEQEALVKPKAEERSEGTREPAFYHSYPAQFYSELIRAFPCYAVVDLTPGEGALAQAAIEHNVVYLGLPFNPDHEKMLMTRLDALLLKSLLQEEHPMYSPELHTHLQQAGVEGGPVEPAGPKPKRRPRKRTPKKKPTTDDEGGDDDGGDNDDEDDLSNDGE